MSTVDSGQFRYAIGHFASGVAVISTRVDDIDHGMTASAVCSLSLEPPMLVVCLNLRSATQAAIIRSERFGVSILEQAQHDVAVRFATPRDDKFADVPYRHGRHGQPLLIQSLARLECDVDSHVVGGTHRVIIGRVRYADAGPGAPLAYYRGRFGRFDVSARPSA